MSIFTRSQLEQVGKLNRDVGIEWYPPPTRRSILDAWPWAVMLAPWGALLAIAVFR